MRKSHTISKLFLPVLLSIGLSATGIDIDGYSIPDSMTLGEKQFGINGCGLREMMWSDIYLVSLYLEEGNGNPEAILDDTLGKVVRLEIIYDDSFPEGLPEIWQEPLREEISREMFALVQELYEDLAPGDIIRFEYQPSAGTAVFHNDERVISQDGATLITTILENWIGADPVSRNLKRLLLSQPCG